MLRAILRPELEAAGVRFAPVDVCLRFGIEHARYIHKGFDMKSLFGHHCRWRRLIGIDLPTVHYRTTQSEVKRAFREMDIVEMLEQRGYKIHFNPE